MVRKIKAKLVLQLRGEGLSGRAIASSQGMSRKSTTAVLEAADVAGISWDDVAERPEGEVYALLFPGRGEHESVFAQPNWDRVQSELHDMEGIQDRDSVFGLLIDRVLVPLERVQGRYRDQLSTMSRDRTVYEVMSLHRPRLLHPGLG